MSFTLLSSTSENGIWAKKSGKKVEYGQKKCNMGKKKKPHLFNRKHSLYYIHETNYLNIPSHYIQWTKTSRNDKKKNNNTVLNTESRVTIRKLIDSIYYNSLLLAD